MAPQGREQNLDRRPEKSCSIQTSSSVAPPEEGRPQSWGHLRTCEETASPSDTTLPPFVHVFGHIKGRKRQDVVSVFLQAAAVPAGTSRPADPWRVWRVWSCWSCRSCRLTCLASVAGEQLMNVTASLSLSFRTLEKNKKKGKIF